MKIYLKPESYIVKTDLSLFMAGSGGTVQQDGYKIFFDGDVQYNGNASEARAKTFQDNRLWDSEECED